MSSDIPVYIYFLSYPMQLFILLLIKLNINAGLTIILLSIFVKVLLFPIEKKINIYTLNKSIKFKKIKQTVSKKVKHLKGEEKFLATNNIYKENNYHPIHELQLLYGLFIQIPFFIAAYFALIKTKIFDNVTFLFLNDLSSEDKYLNLFNIDINILPFIMIIINFLAVYNYSQSLRGGLKDYFIPFIFLVILYNQPSCIVLYWTTNNLIILTQALLTKKLNNL